MTREEIKERMEYLCCSNCTKPECADCLSTSSRNGIKPPFAVSTHDIADELETNPRAKKVILALIASLISGNYIFINKGEKVNYEKKFTKQ